MSDGQVNDQQLPREGTVFSLGWWKLSQKNTMGLRWESNSCSTTAPTPVSVIRDICIRRSSLMCESLVKFATAVFTVWNACRASPFNMMSLFFLCSRFVSSWRIAQFEMNHPRKCRNCLIGVSVGKSWIVLILSGRGAMPFASGVVLEKIDTGCPQKTHLSTFSFRLKCESRWNTSHRCVACESWCLYWPPRCCQCMHICAVVHAGLHPWAVGVSAQHYINWTHIDQTAL